MAWSLFRKRQPLPEKLSICIVANKFPILGRAADHGFLWPIARGLAQRGHRVVVLAWKNPQGKKEIFHDNVMAYFLGEPFAMNPSKFPDLALSKFRELHRETPFHIVHSIDSNGLLIGQLRKEFGVAMTYDVEATRMSELFAVLGLAQESLSSLLSTSVLVGTRFLMNYYTHDRKVLNTADGVFVTSPQQKIALERHYLYPEARTYSVPYGIEIGDLSPREKSDEFRQKLGLPPAAQIVVTISDMTELEVMRNLLRAFEKVAIKKSTARLLIVGDGPLKKEIEYEMLSLALGSRVVFTGAVTSSDLPDYIALADAYVNLSSRSSGFEPSMLEAMAQKKVIIGSEVTPLSTIVEDGRDGFLIRPADINGLAQLILQIFAGQLPAAQIGEQARQKVMELFDTQRMVNQTIDAYCKTLLNTGFYKKASNAASH